MAGWSPSRLSRSERGLRHITTDEVATLLTAWRIPAGEREEVIAEVQAGSSSGWWDRPLPGVPSGVGALASYEADANELVDVALRAVPGSLHTYETAIAVMQAAGVPKEDVETGWMARLRRQQTLGKIDYTAYIDEAALRTRLAARKRSGGSWNKTDTGDCVEVRRDLAALRDSKDSGGPKLAAPLTAFIKGGQGRTV